MIEQVKVVHEGLSYETQRPISEFKDFDWSKASKMDAVHFARAAGFKETGMSVNEIGLLYDLLDLKKPRYTVELGRNYGCSTRIFLQNVIRNGGIFESWDLKHWDGFIEGMRENGYNFGESQEPEGVCYGPMTVGGKEYDVRLRVANSMKTNIISPLEGDDRFVDFLLIDTEHGIENALGEYMRWRNYLRSGAYIAFHDSTLPGVRRSIDLVQEIEDSTCGDRIAQEINNEQVDGFGLTVLKWKG